MRDHVGWVYYQREVRVPRGWHDERILLRFDAATHAARVYVDDRLVGEHVGGYTPFDVDLTDLVAAGGRFRLTVAVSGDLTNETVPPGKIEVGMDGRRRQTYFHDFYNYAGLARSVWLYSTPRVCTSPMSPWSRASTATPDRSSTGSRRRMPLMCGCGSRMPPATSSRRRRGRPAL